jgi:hypothetical protein
MATVCHIPIGQLMQYEPFSSSRANQVTIKLETE